MKNLTAPLSLLRFKLEPLICFALIAFVLSFAQAMIGPLPEWPAIMSDELSTMFVEWSVEVEKIFDF